MRTESVVEIDPPQDRVHIACGRAGRYELVFNRDSYFSKLTLTFPDADSLFRVIDRLKKEADNLRKPIEERTWM